LRVLRALRCASLAPPGFHFRLWVAVSFLTATLSFAITCAHICHRRLARIIERSTTPARSAMPRTRRTVLRRSRSRYFTYTAPTLPPCHAATYDTAHLHCRLYLQRMPKPSTANLLAPVPRWIRTPLPGSCLTVCCITALLPYRTPMRFLRRRLDTFPRGSAAYTGFRALAGAPRSRITPLS